MNTLKDIPGPDGKIKEVCLEGEKCSLFCQWRQLINESLTGKRVPFCSLFHIHHHDIETKGETPHPNCLAPGIDIGPVDHSDAVPGKRYWMASPENRIESPVIEIEIASGESKFKIPSYTYVNGSLWKGEKLSYVLRQPLEIYKNKKHALEHAARLLQGALEKINKEIKE